MRCAARESEIDANRGAGDGHGTDRNKRDGDTQSDTESVGEGSIVNAHINEAVNAQVALLKEQLERAEAQLQV